MALGELDLATSITARLKDRGWTRKRLYLEWHAASGGKHSESTFETRISNLMNDEEAGFAFVLDGEEAPVRLRALAACLALPLEEVESLLTTARARATLIFGDGVDDNVRRYFLIRSARFPGLLRCIQTGSGAPSSRELFRDLALEHRNAIVLVADDRDRDFFAGAGVRTERAHAVGRSFRVVGVPEISLQTAARTVDADGMPMFADATAEKAHRASMTDRLGGSTKSRWVEHIVACDAEEAPVTFRLDWLMEHWGCKPPVAEEVHRAILLLASAKGLPKPELRQEFRDSPRTDAIWRHEGRILRFPKSYGKIPVPVHDLVTFEPLVDAIAQVFRGLNPSGTSLKLDVDAELAAFRQESGIDLRFTAEDLRGMVKTRRAVDGVAVRRGPEHDVHVHERLDEILKREFELPERHAAMIWVLELIRRSPLLHVPAPDGEHRAIAEIGAGNLLEFSIESFASENPTVIRWIDDRPFPFLDGGNVRFKWREGAEKLLEGTTPPVVRRRRDVARNRSAHDE